MNLRFFTLYLLATFTFLPSVLAQSAEALTPVVQYHTWESMSQEERKNAVEAKQTTHQDIIEDRKAYWAKKNAEQRQRHQDKMVQQKEQKQKWQDHKEKQLEVRMEKHEELKEHHKDYVEEKAEQKVEQKKEKRKDLKEKRQERSEAWKERYKEHRKEMKNQDKSKEHTEPVETIEPVKDPVDAFSSDGQQEKPMRKKQDRKKIHDKKRQK